MFLKRLFFENKEFTKELRLECANFLGQKTELLKVFNVLHQHF